MSGNCSGLVNFNLISVLKKEGHSEQLRRILDTNNVMECTTNPTPTGRGAAKKSEATRNPEESNMKLDSMLPTKYFI